MAVKFTCPYCYGVHTQNDCKVKCNYLNPNNPKDPCYEVDSKTPAKDAAGFINPKYYGKCFKCKHASIQLYCPEMPKEIPQDFLFGESFSIALLGAKASGKSNYIGVLINEIRKRLSRQFNATMNTAASQESQRYYMSQYYDVLYTHKNVVPATSQIAIPPLIFPLRFLDKNDRIKKVAALTFYDTAGENFDTKESINIKTRYIPNANGIIILLDPLQVPAIRDKLQGKMPLPAKNTDAADILNQVSESIRTVKKIKGKIKTPIALVFTKIDALDDFLPEDSILKEESYHLDKGAFVLEDFKLVNSEMEILMENWIMEDSDIGQQLKNFEKVAFFGISSLGQAPDGVKLNKPITPRRVLDPVLWLFAESGYINKVKK